MKFWKKPLGPIQTNGYIISNEQGQGVIFDPGMDPEEMLHEIEGLKIEAILLTHAHFDHIGGLNQVRDRTGAPVYIHQQEQEWLTNPELNGSVRWPMVTEPIICSQAEQTLHGGETLQLAGFEINVLHTPGHSPGSVSFYFKEHGFIIAGDTLFAESIGRTDLRGGDHEQLVTSIKQKLFTLPADTQVFPGHGPSTTIKQEKQYNPFVGQE